jgi:cbb3-type cytochrome oxidase maturation protein
MLEYLTLYEFVVALLMAAAGACAFLWATVTGVWRDVEAAKHRVLEAEEAGDG